VVLLLCIQDILGSNLSPKTNIISEVFLWFYTFSPGKYRKIPQTCCDLNLPFPFQFVKASQINEAREVYEISKKLLGTLVHLIA
jgi:hypothetical protein